MRKILYAAAMTVLMASPALAENIGVSMAKFDDNFLTVLRNGMQDYAKTKEGVNLQVEDAQNDVSKQLSQIQNFIAQGVDAIIVNPVDTDATPAMTKLAVAAGVPLVYVNRMPSDNPLPAKVSFVGSNEVDSGTLEMQEVCKIMGGKGNILVLMGELSNQAARQRTQDIHDVIAKPECSGIKIVEEQTGNWDRTQGTDLMTNWISSGVQFDAVVSNNDEMAIGAIQALKAAGVDMNKVIVAGVDATQDALAAMKAGELDVTVFQNAAGSGLWRGRHRAEARQGRERGIHGLGSLRTGHTGEYGPVSRKELIRLDVRGARNWVRPATAFASSKGRDMSSAASAPAAQDGTAAATPGFLLQVEGVRKEFPGVVALDNVSFRLKAGTVHALMGENGAGKSTLMKIIAGIYHPDSGSFQLRGKDIRLTSPLDALENGIAMIHQELNLMPFMTVAENIWIRREPKTALGFVDHARAAPQDRGPVREAQHQDRSGDRGARPVGCEPPDGGDRQGGLLRIRCPDHGRADLGPDRAGSLASVRDHPRPAGTGQRHRLHHPQDERAVRDRGRVLGVPRRPLHRHASGARRDARRHHPHDGRARDHPDVSERGGADRRCAHGGQESHPQGRVPRRVVRGAVGRDPGRRRAWSDRAAATSRRPSSA